MELLCWVWNGMVWPMDSHPEENLLWNSFMELHSLKTKSWDLWPKEIYWKPVSVNLLPPSHQLTKLSSTLAYLQKAVLGHRSRQITIFRKRRNKKETRRNQERKSRETTKMTENDKYKISSRLSQILKFLENQGALQKCWCSKRAPNGLEELANVQKVAFFDNR